MIYYDYPEEKTDIFEKSDKNYFYVIISNKPKNYVIQSWENKLTSYELRDDSTGSSALNPIIFPTAEEALAKAISLSKKKRNETFMVAQWFDDFDRR